MTRPHGSRARYVLDRCGSAPATRWGLVLKPPMRAAR